MFKRIPTWAWVGGVAGLTLLAGGQMSYALAYSRGKPVGKIGLKKVFGVLMETRTAAAFGAMVSAAAQAGIRLVPASGFRSMADQIRLYALYKAGLGNKAAQPGWSNHQNGRAVDIKVGNSFTSAEYRWLAANAPRFGFDNTEGKGINEPWHWVRVAS